MNTRERILAILLLVVIIVVGGGFLGYVFYLKPLGERESRLISLRTELAKRETEIQQIQQNLPRLERWKQLSLPANTDLARREYERFLTDLLRESGYAPGSYSVTPPRAVDSKSSSAPMGKGPVYTRLTYKVHAPATLGQFVRFLERFYRTALLHQIRGMTIKRTTNTARANELEVELVIEALVLNGPESRLRPVAYAVTGGATWAARPSNRVAASVLATPPRDYEALAARNIFLGPPPPPAENVADRTEVTRAIYLTGITRGVEEAEASLYYRYNNRRWTVRPESEQDTFPILQDPDGRTLVEGVLVYLEERDIYFRVRLATDSDQLSRGFTDPKRWSPPDARTLEGLIRDKILQPEESENGRVFQIGRASWDMLEREELVEVRDREFAFRWDLVRGRLLRMDDRSVVVQVDEKCCAYRGLAASESRSRRRRVEPHSGYFAYHVGESLDEALSRPLPEDQVKEILKAAALPQTGNGARRD